MPGFDTMRVRSAHFVWFVHTIMAGFSEQTLIFSSSGRKEYPVIARNEWDLKTCKCRSLLGGSDFMKRHAPLFIVVVLALALFRLSEFDSRIWNDFRGV